MTTIDNEIGELRRRLADLEEKKKTTPNIEKLEAFLTDKQLRVNRNSYSKLIPLAQYYDREKIEFLQPILNALKDINQRLIALESKP